MNMSNNNNMHNVWAIVTIITRLMMVLIFGLLIIDIYFLKSWVTVTDTLRIKIIVPSRADVDVAIATTIDSKSDINIYVK